MPVKCIVPVRLYGEFAGDYARDTTYPDDRLADAFPGYFAIVPESGPAEPVRDLGDPDGGTPPPHPSTETKTKRRK